MNQRPLGPQPSALPDCATPRDSGDCRGFRPVLMRTCVRMTDELRTCGGCGLSKPLDQFSWRRRKRMQRDNMCRGCRSEYGKAHYEANKPRYIQNAARVKKATKLERIWYLLEYFEDHPCADCGESDPVVLDFDHLTRQEVQRLQGIRGEGLGLVLEEIKKCEVVCANCHRVRTAAGWGSLRYRISRGLDLEDESG